jgi:DNA polymerase-3 subunit beta
MIDTDTVVETGLNVTCSRDDFAQRLAVVGRAVSTRGAVQILSGILLRADAGELELAATDMELSLRSSLAAEVAGEGAVVVPGRLLLELSRLLPESEVRLEHRADEGMVQLTCGSASYRLHTYSADDFPRLPDVRAAEMFSVDRESLLDTVARVSGGLARPVAAGIYPDPR